MEPIDPAEPPRPDDAPTLDETALAEIRARIDDMDRVIIDALSERARLVVRIGGTKRALGLPIYAPHRERQVLDRVLRMNPGPLPPRCVEAIYRELMSGSFALELPLRVAYLGPPGSFSHLVATRQFGSSVEFSPFREIIDVFEEVGAGRCHYGLVPYENSIGGGITDTLDAFQAFRVTVCAEALLAVRQTFLSNHPPGEIDRIYSKPQVFSQCRKWLARMYERAELVPATSTSEAVRLAAGTPRAAAIGSPLAGEIYGVKPLFDHIEDNPHNVTRFLVIGREPAKPTGDDRTSIMFVTAHRPGALVDVLAAFRDAGVNLSHIEKRPSGRTNWEYTFFIDCDAHREDAAMTRATAAARAHCARLEVLGSYPRAQSIL
ncbi:MAG: prephenate dehydratase [Phycisphaeraceae bacterium]|nr:prephenate dehydratase [Phycisphaeraceae bacterium]